MPSAQILQAAWENWRLHKNYNILCKDKRLLLWYNIKKAQA